MKLLFFLVTARVFVQMVLGFGMVLLGVIYLKVTAHPLVGEEVLWAGSTWNISNITGDLTIRDSMMYDTNRDRVILLDGNGGRAGSTSSISEWDGSRWIDVTPTAPNPPARLLSAMAYDSAAQKGLLFGGTNANNTVNFSDTWELLPPDRSTVQFAMTLPDDLTEDMISNVRVRAFCGATYADNTGVASFGAQLVGWVSGGLSNPQGDFKQLETNVASISTDTAAAILDYRPNTSSPAEAAQEAKNFVGPNRRLYFQCRPNGSSGSGFAEVAADYMEVRLKYRAVP